MSIIFQNTKPFQKLRLILLAGTVAITPALPVTAFAQDKGPNRPVTAPAEPMQNPKPAPDAEPVPTTQAAPAMEIEVPPEPALGPDGPYEPEAETPPEDAPEPEPESEPAPELTEIDRLARAYFEATTHAERSAARSALSATAETEPGAAYALIAADFFGGFERFFAAMGRHGFVAEDIGNALIFGEETAERPVEPITYEILRGELLALRDTLADAADRFEAMPRDGNYGVRIDLSRMMFDLSGGSDDAGLLPLIVALGFAEGLTDGAVNAGSAEFRFDAADTIWMAGYAHVILANLDFMLAHDFSRTFDASFTLFFPRTAPFADQLVPPPEPGGNVLDLPFADRWRVADLIAFIHLMDLPVGEPERKLLARQHLLKVIGLSRENWQAIRAETDNNQEWLPGPQQGGIHPITETEVTEEQVAAWHAALDNFESVATGELLIPHWRFPGKGINIARLLDDDANFDPVMLITGFGALPYLEEGEILDVETWGTEFGEFGPLGLVGTAFWFN